LEQKLHLFRTAASKPEWDVAYCAAVIAVNTTCRKVELLTARWVGKCRRNHPSEA